MIRSLVTGGAGMLGSHIVDSLVELGHDVLVLDDLSGGYADNVNSAATLIRGSITDLSVLAEIFVSHQIDYIFHCAAYAAEGLSHFIRRYNYTNNLIGSINLINAAVNHGGVKCFVFTSSIAVYGGGQYLNFLEVTKPNPEDPYGIAKYAVEMDLGSANRMFGLNYIVFRPHSVYGERQNMADPYRNVVGIFMNQCMNKQPLTIFGDGNQTRAFTHVSDVAPLIANSINTPMAYNNTFNVGADIPYSVNRLAEAVQEAMGTNLPITHLDKREEVQHAYSDHVRARHVFGYKPKVTLEDGLSRMAAWAKKLGPQKGKPFTNIEIERNMPPSWRQLSWHGCPLP
jgi:UDP-glucose 4-epimerase